ATAVGSYLFYVQHNFPQAKLYNRSQWDYIDAAMKSTSYFKMGPLMSWVTGNIGYHHIHHINHRIPFYNLPKAMENILVLNEVEVTRWCFADIHANFACNLWDEEGETFIRYNALR
ncbi:fatty acid desaturase, partial [Serratia marcescens]